MPPLTTDLDYAVVHQTSKRLRIQVPRLRSDTALASDLQSRLEAVKGVKAVRINRAACSVIVHLRDRPLADPVAPQVLSLLEEWRIPSTASAPEPVEGDAAVDSQASVSTPTAPQPPPITAPSDPGPPTGPLPEPLIQRDLAQRLGVSSQAITPRRQQPTFPDWSQEQDPDGIAWCYRPESGTFHPLSEMDQGSNYREIS